MTLSAPKLTSFKPFHIGVNVEFVDFAIINRLNMDTDIKWEGVPKIERVKDSVYYNDP